MTFYNLNLCEIYIYIMTLTLQTNPVRSFFLSEVITASTCKQAPTIVLELVLSVIKQLTGYVVLFEEVWVRTCISQPIKMSQQLARASSRKESRPSFDVYIFSASLFQKCLGSDSCGI